MIRKRKVLGLVEGLILSNVVCCLAKDVCYYSNNNYEVYCDDGYYCCQNNTRCCSEGISTGAIIGIILASIFVLAICVAGGLLLTKKQKAPSRRVGHVQNISVINPPPYTQSSAPPPNYNSQGNYFPNHHPPAPPPYTPAYPPPPAYTAT